MDPHEHDQLSRLKAMLEQQMAALETQDTPETGELAVSEVETSPADMATVRLLNDLAHEAASHNATHLSSIRHALSKFNDGSYGLCEQCSEPVGLARLEARPEARLCINCQTRAEKH